MRTGGEPINAALVACLLLAAGLAGCLGEDAGQDVEAGPSGNRSQEDPVGDEGEPSGEDVPDGNVSVGVNETRPSGVPSPRTLYFDEGPALTQAIPDAGAVDLPGGASAIMVDRPLAVFESQPVERPLFVEAVALSVEMWLEIDAPQPSTSEFDLVLWFGSTRGVHVAKPHALEEPVVTPGEPVHVTFEVPFDDARGFLVPTGEKLVAHLAASQTGEEANLERLLVGGETPSSLTFTATPLAEDPSAGLADASPETLTGTVPASVNPTDCRMQDGVNGVMHPVEVPANATALELTLTGEDRSPHREDLDLHVHAENGDIVLRTVSQNVNENMILAGATLEGLRGSTLGAMVVACNDAAKDYQLDVRTV